MSAMLCLTPVSDLDEPFLNELYASTRAAEMAVVAWSDEQKRAFVKMQFEAQNEHYRQNYPAASFEIIKLNDQPIGRFYLAELADEIRIIDLAFLPQHFERDTFIKIIEKVLRKSETIAKPVQIYLESFNPLAEIFTGLGFQKVGEHGIYFLWQKQPANMKSTVRSLSINA